MSKIKNMEFLRVIACVAIVVYHLFYARGELYLAFPDISIYEKLMCLTRNTNKAVDLFFILSGLFFALKFDPSKSIFHFIKKKLIRFYPVLIFVTLLFFLASLFLGVKFLLYDNIINSLLLSSTGFRMSYGYGNVLQFWYVSAIFWVLLLYAYLIKFYDKKHIYPFAVISMFFGYTFIINDGGGIIGGTIVVDKFYNLALLRALGGVGAGFLIGEWYKTYKNEIEAFKPDFKTKLIFTFLEILFISLSISNVYFSSGNITNQIIFVIYFVFTVITLLLKKGFVSEILDKNLWEFLGKYTYSIFMTHIFAFVLLDATLWKFNRDFVFSHPLLNLSIAAALVLILGALTYHFIEAPSAKFLKNVTKADN